ncbi:AAA family ATPase [Telmatocola sphagniphila]|uniref:AAA family ATPase n=1 Tax=Telmatocola sphagniphila TaxID=1123043 RepID=A0A8E6BCD0_9BACT|nr:AAA family ATPase [Telmatocola sphagniphila]QVL34295.1 AAA family ATPase [Telmatocola sphagniphila]
MIIGVIGQKGGGGKTTVSLCLAAAAAQNRKAAVILDIDQQANAAKWRDRRKVENVAVVGTLQSRIKQTLETARQHGADFVVIDSPGHNDTAAMETVRAADLVILPVEPQMFHFDTLPAMRDLIRMAGDKPTWLLINKLHPAASVQAEKLKKMMADAYDLPVSPVHWSRLDIYATSTDIGSTPSEEEPDCKASEEVRSLYKFICQQFNKVRNQHVKDARVAESVE